ncbi:hypothetical protein HPB50_021497 [Hyalomma asiaticum]|uniref:Uncharacterized protein n=1 Tax=Hyalomma asiaticum TaxID=266040 RepID=A0ACB7SHM3_HYAAI|nr:hypothetical protein HPB50_021497 [Hyalomma asiaticum]
MDRSWGVAGAASLTAFFTVVMMMNSGFFYVALIEEFGITREAASWPMSVMSIVSHSSATSKFHLFSPFCNTPPPDFSKTPGESIRLRSLSEAGGADFSCHSSKAQEMPAESGNGSDMPSFGAAPGQKRLNIEGPSGPPESKRQQGCQTMSRPSSETTTWLTWRMWMKTASRLCVTAKVGQWGFPF